MQLLYAFFTFLFSTAYVLFLDYILHAPHLLQKVLVVPIILIVIVLYRSAKNSWALFSQQYNKWLFLFCGTMFIELLILATDGTKSPFLILIHLFMVGISFFFSFSVGLLFLMFSFVAIFIDMSFYQDVITTLTTKPTAILLQIASLISIIPIAYLVSKQYHAKEMLSSLLKNKLERDQAIFSSLQEMIFITDLSCRILSVNDAAARNLQQTPTELLNKSLFDALLLRDNTDKLVTKDAFFPNGDMTKPPKKFSQPFTLMRALTPQRQVTVSIQPFQATEARLSEVSFIVSFVQSDEKGPSVTLDKARARYEALMQNIKKQLTLGNLQTLPKDILLLEKIESDTYLFHSLQKELKKTALTKIDMARLCKQVLAVNQAFTQGFGVETSYTLHNFGEKDVKPLTVKNYAVKPEELTGPFFTVSSQARQIELLIQKLLDLATLISSSLPIPQKSLIAVTVTPKEKEVEVTISATCPPLKKEDLSDIFVPYYGKLAGKTNLLIGSGLEGFLVKQLAEQLSISLDVELIKIPQETISFKLIIKKIATLKR